MLCIEVQGIPGSTREVAQRITNQPTKGENPTVPHHVSFLPSISEPCILYPVLLEGPPSLVSVNNVS